MITYDAFISYSHAKDKPIAAMLQSVIQTLGKPWYRRRAIRVFRDDTSLSATPHLWPSIEQALSQSRYLILIASPEAAGSMWVGKEVAYWLENKSVDTLLIGVTDGDISWDQELGDFTWPDTTPLPGVLKGRFPTEPKWVDLRAYRAAATRRDPILTDRAADFAAAVRGVPKEDLLSQEVRQQRRALALAWSAVGVLLVLFGLAGWQWSEAVAAKTAALRSEGVATEQRKIADEQRIRAEKSLEAATQTSNSLVSDLAREFRGKKGIPIEVVRKTLDRARGLQQQLAAAGEKSPKLQHGQVLALNDLITTYMDQGDTDSARRAAEESRKIVEELLATDPNNIDWQASLSRNMADTGLVFERLGQMRPALEAYRASLASEEKLAAMQPRNGRWYSRMGDRHQSIGDVLRALGDRAGALAAYQRTLKLADELATTNPDNTDFQVQQANALTRVGDMLNLAGRHGEAVDALLRSIAITERLTATDPNNVGWQEQLWSCYMMASDALGFVGRQADAEGTAQKAIALAETLVAGDPGNASKQWRLSISFQASATSALTAKRYDDAIADARKGLAIRHKLATADPRNVRWQSGIGDSYARLGAFLAEAGRQSDALEAYRRSLEIYQKLNRDDPQSADWQWHLAVAYSLIGERLTAQTEQPDAIEAHHKALELREKLIALDPENARWHIDLVRTLLALAILGDDARPRLTRALQIAGRLESEGKLTANMKGVVKTIERRLAALAP